MKLKTTGTLSPLNVLRIFVDELDSFVASTMSVFSSLRDRNTRKAFVKDEDVWSMEQYIDLKQFEKEILNTNDEEEEMKNNGGNVQPLPQAQNQGQGAYRGFNPFRNQEFGYDEMFGGMHEDPAIQAHHDEVAEAQQNAQRFEDNFNVDAVNGGDIDEGDYRRSFLILIEIPWVIPFKLRVKLFYALIAMEKVLCTECTLF